MKYSVVFSSNALETYYLILEQLEIRWSAKIAEEFEQRVVKVVNIIQESPFVYQSVNDKSNIRKGYIHGNCSVLYEVKEDQIEILLFWDNRQDPIL
ncbi:type II toxin-antitoxin system RelE/ParE family toxin [Mucilaginibacter litoreus]|uniref:Type II toxin-antitoxin system RelE/ParE family toxin n=1 Tax=Mucilaginibacter litoreus TaxID=1048221 RepID=A0ABW3AS45_9SPHI